MTLGSAAGTAARILAGLCLVTCNSLVAQDAGNRVRVTIDGEVLTGDVVEAGNEGFTMALSDEEVVEVSHAEIEHLELRTCCIDYVWAYPTVAGVLVGGLGAAYASDSVTCSDTSMLGLARDDSCEIEGNSFWWGILGGGVAGFAVAKLVFRENWESIPISGRNGPTVSPLIDVGSGRHGNTMTLGARVRF